MASNTSVVSPGSGSSAPPRDGNCEATGPLAVSTGCGLESMLSNDTSERAVASLIASSRNAPVGKLSSADLIELLDGYLVSFDYTNGAWAGEAVPYQQVMRIDGRGRVREVARRPLSFDLPLAYTMRNWWLSPVLRELCLSLQGAFAAPNPLAAGDIPPPPRHIVVLAGLMCLLSLLGAIVLTRRRGFTPLARLAWVLACGVVGLPALASLWLLFPASQGVSAKAAPRTHGTALLAGEAQ